MTAVTVERSALVRVAGLAVGIMRMNSDPADPAARLAVSDVASGEREVIEVRAGDQVPFAGRLLTVTGLTVGPPRTGRVELDVTGTGEGADPEGVTGTKETGGGETRG
jgi:hypothetical protein